ncbi:MAG: hypothetical protein ACRDM7_11100 [Thermoleophilaceae bacterium]
MKRIQGLAAAVAALAVLAAAPAADAKRADTFEVTFTDLTSGQDRVAHHPHAHTTAPRSMPRARA